VSLPPFSIHHLMEIRLKMLLEQGRVVKLGMTRSAVKALFLRPALLNLSRVLILLRTIVLIGVVSRRFRLICLYLRAARSIGRPRSEGRLLLSKRLVTFSVVFRKLRGIYGLLEVLGNWCSRSVMTV